MKEEIKEIIEEQNKIVDFAIKSGVMSERMRILNELTLLNIKKVLPKEVWKITNPTA